MSGKGVTTFNLSNQNSNWLGNWSDNNSCGITLGYNINQNANNELYFSYNLKKITNDGDPGFTKIPLPSDISNNMNVTSASILTDTSGNTWVIVAFITNNPSLGDFETYLYIINGDDNDSYNGITSGNNWSLVTKLKNQIITSIVADNINDQTEDTNNYESENWPIYGTTFFMVISTYGSVSNGIYYVQPIGNQQTHQTLNSFIEPNSVYVSYGNTLSWYCLGANGGLYSNPNILSNEVINIYNIYGNTLFINVIPTTITENNINISTPNRVFVGIMFDPSDNVYIYETLITFGCKNVPCTPDLSFNFVSAVIPTSQTSGEVLSQLNLSQLFSYKNNSTIYTPITSIIADPAALIFLSGSNIYYTQNPYTYDSVKSDVYKSIPSNWTVGNITYQDSNWDFVESIVSVSSFYYIFTNTNLFIYTLSPYYYCPSGFGESNANKIAYETQDYQKNLISSCNIITNNTAQEYGNLNFFMFSSTLNSQNNNGYGQSYGAYYDVG